MSLDLICKEMTPYPHWTMEVYSGVGNKSSVRVRCDKLGYIFGYGDTEMKASEDALANIKAAKFKQNCERYDV